MARKAKTESRFDAMRAAFDRAVSLDKDNRQLALDDVNFVWVEGNQWDQKLKKDRQQEGRPCFEFNKLKPTIKQVLNDQRQNRPQVKIRATEDGDKDLAEIMQGLIRNIEAHSAADVAYDEAFRFAVTGGYGVWRIRTDYENQEGFDQCIKIEPIRNPFTVYFDANAKEFDRRDARHVWVTEVIGREEFRQRYPKAKEVDFAMGSAGDQFIADWWMEDSVRIAEYWYKESRKKDIVQLSSGEVIEGDKFAMIADELAANGITEVRRRTVEYDQVMVEIVSGSETLEGPTEWAGKFIPVIPVWGELTNIDGRDRYTGLVRNARDAQALYNFHRSVLVEAIANAPKQPFMATPKMLEGHENQWQRLGVANDPVLLFNPDPDAPGGRPTREAPPDFPTSIANAHALDADDIKAVTSIYDASLGARSNETSGRAIMARQREADVGTFDYIDNLSRAIRYQGEILVDLIPKIYDTERVIRVLGEDGADKYVKLNQSVYDTQTGQMVIVNDLSAAKFDVAVNVGPSYTTQRMEAAEILMQMSSNPVIGPMVADLIVKSLDLPGSEEVEKRLRKMMLAQGIVEHDPEKDGPAPEPQPQGPPPEVMMKQAELEQQMMTKQAEIQAQMQMRQMDAEAKAIAERDKQQAENERIAYKARMDAMIAEAEIRSRERMKAAELEAQAILESIKAESAARSEAIRAAQGEAESGNIVGAIESIRELAQRMSAPRTVVRDNNGEIIGVKVEAE